MDSANNALINMLPSLPASLQLQVARNIMMAVGAGPGPGSLTNMSEQQLEVRPPSRPPGAVSNNSDETCSDDGTSDRRSKSDRRHRGTRGKNKIEPVVQGGEQHFICPLCKAAFGQQHELTMHIRAHNSGGSTVNACTLCGKQLSSQSSLDRHMLVHSGERPFCCRICAMSFTTNGNMHRHMAVHEKDMPVQWKAVMNEKRRRRNSAKLAKLSDASSATSGCKSAAPAAGNSLSSCTGEAPTDALSPGSPNLPALGNLSSIWLSQVPYLQTLSNFLKPLPASTPHSEAEDQDRFEQDDVDARSNSLSRSTSAPAPDDADMPADGDADDAPDQSRLCVASQSDSASSSADADAESVCNMAAHEPDQDDAPSAAELATPPAGSEKPRKCRYCSESFDTVNALRVHIRGHHGLSPYRCEVCDYTSVDKSTLVRHMRTHNGQRPFRCADCGYAFTTKANCERHIKTRHLKTTKQELLNAMAFVGGPWTAPDTVCPVCAKTLPSLQGLNKHLRARHAGVTLPATAESSQLSVQSCSADAEPVPDPQPAQPTAGAPFDYATWVSLFGTLHKLASVGACAEPSKECGDCEQAEPLDLTVKAKPTDRSDKQTGLSVGTSQHDSGFSSAKTLSPDGALDTREGVQLGPLALLTLYHNVLAASSQLTQPTASLGDNHGCTDAQNATPASAALIADMDTHRPATATHSEKCDVPDELASDTDADADADEDEDQLDESDVDVCDEQCASDAQDTMHADDSCTANRLMTDDGASETEASASKKKRNSYSDSPRRIQCPYCTRSFPWISSLKRHLITHTGQKPFRCPRCSLNFSTKSNRERHLLRKHGVKVHGAASACSPSVQHCKPAAQTLELTVSSARSNPSGSSATLEDSELRDMTVADSIADSIGENLLKSASLVMSPNRSRLAARKSGNDGLKLLLDMRQLRRDGKKPDSVQS